MLRFFFQEMLRNHGIYVSHDEVNRSSARSYGIADVNVHPRTVGTITDESVVVLDFDHVMFADKPAILLLAAKAADAGAIVGIHSYFPDDVKLDMLRKRANVVVERNLAQLVPALRKLRNASAANTGSAKEVRHDPDHHIAETDHTHGIASDATQRDVPALGGTGRATQYAASPAAGS